MFVITVLVFLIFFKTPGVDPARAHRRPQPQPADPGRDPGPVRAQPAAPGPVPADDEAALRQPQPGVVLEPGPAGRAGDLRGRAGHAVAGVRRRRASGWCVAIVMGVAAAAAARHAARPGADDPGADRRVHAGRSGWARWPTCITQGKLHNSFLFSWVPPLGYTPFTTSPALWFEGLILPVDHAVDPVHRLLRPGAAGQPARDPERGLRAHRPGQGPVASGASLVRHTLRNSMITFVSLFGLDFGALVGGGRDPDRGGLRHPRRRASSPTRP